MAVNTEKIKRDKLKFLIFILLIAAVIFLSSYFNLHNFFQVEKIRILIDSYGMYAPIIYIVLYGLASLFFLPGSILTITAGILFGTLYGAIYAVIGASVGATVSFLVSRYFARAYIEDLTKTKLKKLKTYDEKLEKHGFSTILFLRLVPIFPFNGLNFGLGITGVKLKDYFFATLIGIIPGTVAYVYFGDSLAMFDPINILIAVSLLILLGLILPVHNYLKKRKGKKNEKDK